ncbi:hypothetical protein BDQ17DRAFT_1346022 [Cyathus striatus]|nr:hypothetical protein BDQ17DRAFT_1346022 [Cyathus striatus]
MPSQSTTPSSSSRTPKARAMKRRRQPKVVDEETRRNRAAMNEMTGKWDIRVQPTVHVPETFSEPSSQENGKGKRKARGSRSEPKSKRIRLDPEVQASSLTSIDNTSGPVAGSSFPGALDSVTTTLPSLSGPPPTPIDASSVFHSDDALSRFRADMRLMFGEQLYPALQATSFSAGYAEQPTGYTQNGSNVYNTTYQQMSYIPPAPLPYQGAMYAPNVPQWAGQHQNVYIAPQAPSIMAGYTNANFGFTNMTQYQAGQRDRNVHSRSVYGPRNGYL